MQQMNMDIVIPTSKVDSVIAFMLQEPEHFDWSISYHAAANKRESLTRFALLKVANASFELSQRVLNLIRE